jgi:hypothetical protein
MTLFNVHIYREMRLRFDGIEADSPEAAAAIARQRTADDASIVEECDGITLAALVDEVGDEEYELSVTIDFEQDPRSGPGRRDPIVAITVRGGLIEDIAATVPLTVVTEDWDVFDEDTGGRPLRNIDRIESGMPGAKAEKLRRLIADDTTSN